MNGKSNPLPATRYPYNLKLTKNIYTRYYY